MQGHPAFVEFAVGLKRLRIVAGFCQGLCFTAHQVIDVHAQQHFLEFALDIGQVFAVCWWLVLLRGLCGFDGRQLLCLGHQLVGRAGKVLFGHG